MASVAVALAACSGDEDASPETTTPDITTTTIEAPRVSDGRLTIGVMLPTAETLLREPLEDAVDDAVARINAGGGVIGRPVRLVKVDEGPTVASAAAAVESLLTADVDAIVGPSSSPAALGTLATIVDDDVLACSPTASAMALDDFPDGELFFRTIPSDSLQAEAIAQIAAETGRQTAAIVHVDDAFGRPYADAVSDALAVRPITVTDSISFAVDDEPTAAAAEVVASEASVVIVLADAADGVQFLAELDAIGGNDAIATIIANDAIRDPGSAQRIAALGDGLRERLVGVAAQAVSDVEPYDPPGPFATNAYDCVNLIALSAERVQSDEPREIAGQMAAVSAGGSPCRSFEECALALDEGLQINYDGPSGITELSVLRGDPSRARFELFRFDVDGRDEVVGSFVAEN